MALLGGLESVGLERVDEHDADLLGTCFWEREKNCLMLNFSDDFPSDVVVGETALDGLLLLAGRSGCGLSSWGTKPDGHEVMCIDRGLTWRARMGGVGRRFCCGVGGSRRYLGQ